ncbi:hypothetical protein CK203_026715 [Vitis vinifera]|uniref:Uncharacterized protein n=1 Tax=Vitis vinifera TaxID=29760 RepID=A0A438IUS3_VITVI|nr:hypothetical protein CK203_026715 [Vitis vinifera]
MGFIPSSLENPGRTLSGFNSSSTTSLGDVTLPVQAGPVILNVLFSVVEDLSPFNVILGRTWLHEASSLPRQCYQIASKARTPVPTVTSPNSTRRAIIRVTDWVVSTVLLRSLLPREQRPVYFINKALADAKTRHNGKDATMGDRAERIWDRLSAQTIPEGQVMTDFIAELLEARAPDKESTSDDWWSMHVDGPPARPDKESDSSQSTNRRTQLPARRGANTKRVEAKDERMVKYLLKVQESLSRLREWVIEEIPRGDNVQADALAGIAVSFPVKESTMIPGAKCEDRKQVKCAPRAHRERARCAPRSHHRRARRAPRAHHRRVRRAPWASRTRTVRAS